jgi:hypothetical protein
MSDGLRVQSSLRDSKSAEVRRSHPVGEKARERGIHTPSCAKQMLIEVIIWFPQALSIRNELEIDPLVNY